MNFALDNGISNRAADALRNAGHRVVYHTGHEPDHWWTEEAWLSGAEVFVSPDWDIEIIAHNYGAKFIRLPQGVGGKDQARFILKQINK